MLEKTTIVQPAEAPLDIQDGASALVCANQNLLAQLANSLTFVSAEIFSTQPDSHTSSIGMHVRHIVEFYHELFKALDHDKSEVCYDKRERNMLLETSKSAAIQAISTVVETLNTIAHEDRAITLSVALDEAGQKITLIPSTIHRELFQVLDHSIHHMAIIKMIGEKQNTPFDQHFGVTHSTQIWRKSVQQ